ncbi:MAG: vWA domain-containing protein [Lutimonas sp.]
MIIAILTAILISSITVYLFYWRPKKQSPRNALISSFLRGFALFLILLLIFDPKIKVPSQLIEKSNLLVLIDQSSSVIRQNKDSVSKSIKDYFENDDDLNNNFNISYYSFAKDISVFDGDTVLPSETNIYRAISNMNELFRKNRNAIVLLTDGNQNKGINYTYAPNKIPVFPIVLGDTTTQFDLSIHKINVNKYSFIGQKFPLEVFVQYDGKQPIKPELKIFKDGSLIAKKDVNLSAEKRSSIIKFELESENVGTHFYSVKIDEIEGEKGLINNSSPFSINVIDEKAKVLILYKYLHPDVGFWKRMIEINEQREVEVSSVIGFKKDLSNYKSVILVGYDNSFNMIYKEIRNGNINHLIETTSTTNFDELKTQNRSFSFLVQPNITPVKVIGNNYFSEIELTPLFLDKYPPLSSKLKELKMRNPHDVLWEDNLKNPLMLFENNNYRSVHLFAENLFQWQFFNGINSEGREQFEDYFDGIIQFLQFQFRDQVTLDYKKLIFKDEQLEISLKIYDANFNSNNMEEMIIDLSSENGEFKKSFPMVFKNNEYVTSLILPPGKYKFSIDQISGKRLTGSFQVLDYSAEDRDHASNYKDLNQIAIQSNGKIFLPNGIDSLKSILYNSKSFTPIIKEQITERSFVDIKWILALITVSLALDWFFRKSQGFY